MLKTSLQISSIYHFDNINITLLWMEGAINTYLDLLCGGLPGPAIGLPGTSLSFLAELFLSGSSKRYSCNVWYRRKQGAGHISSWQTAH